MDDAIRVLLVEDNPGDVGLVRAALEESATDFEIDNVTSTQSCRRALETGHYDILLLDYSLPGETGLDFLRSVSQKEKLPPVIMLTGLGDELIAKDAIISGAYDYCSKLRITPETLTRTILEAIEKARLQAEEERQREEADRRAITDPLTGLYNRHLYRRSAREGMPPRPALRQPACLPDVGLGRVQRMQRKIRPPGRRRRPPSGRDTLSAAPCGISTSPPASAATNSASWRRRPASMAPCSWASACALPSPRWS